MAAGHQGVLELARVVCSEQAVSLLSWASALCAVLHRAPWSAVEGGKVCSQPLPGPPVGQAHCQARGRPVPGRGRPPGRRILGQLLCTASFSHRGGALRFGQAPCGCGHWHQERTLRACACLGRLPCRWFLCGREWACRYLWVVFVFRDVCVTAGGDV